MADLAERIAERIRREGPIPFDRFVDAALYDEDGGFYARGGGAGRAGRDFVTSPEVGVLFGALVARYLDRAWTELSRPDPFVVVDAGAGRGRLAADVLRAEPECSRALRYVLVERSAALRVAQRELLTLEPADRAFGPAVRDDPDEAPRPVEDIGPIATSLPEFPAIELPAGVVIANELLDNLPFRLVERARARVDGGAGRARARRIRRGRRPGAARGRRRRRRRGRRRHDPRLAPASPSRPPPSTGSTSARVSCGAASSSSSITPTTAASLAARRKTSGSAPTAATSAARHRSPRPARRTSRPPCRPSISSPTPHAPASGSSSTPPRRTWLAALGVDELVDDARGLWRERAAVGDLEALAARSRVTEAAALTDPSGLGAHHVFVFAKGAVGG